MNDELLEKLAEAEHIQWCEWAQSVSAEIGKLIDIIDNNQSIDLSDEERQNIADIKNKMNRWDDLFIPYSDLSEEMKDKDRVYAKRIIDIVENQQ